MGNDLIEFLFLILRIDFKNHFIIKDSHFPFYILTLVFERSSFMSDSSSFNAPEDNQ